MPKRGVALWARRLGLGPLAGFGSEAAWGSGGGKKRKHDGAQGASAVGAGRKKRKGAAGAGASGKKYACEDCSYATDRKSSFDRHRRKHTGDKPFGCKYCTFRSARKSAVTRHIRAVHKGDKPFGCTYCTFRSAWRSAVTAHIRRKHPDPDTNKAIGEEPSSDESDSSDDVDQC